jgi:hypothetical protein
MFETQNSDTWFPEWLLPWKPFFLSLAVTPFAFIIGASDFGPEGPQIFLGYLIFPYSAFVFFLAASLSNSAVAYLAILLLIIQFPIYGILLSLATNRRLIAVRIALAHLCAILFTVFALLALMVSLTTKST